MTAGGKRPGAGRPVGSTKPGGRTRQVNLRLTEANVVKAEAIGQGNASAGLRTALEAYPVTPCDLAPAAE